MKRLLLDVYEIYSVIFAMCHRPRRQRRRSSKRARTLQCGACTGSRSLHHKYTRFTPRYQWTISLAHIHHYYIIVCFNLHTWFTVHTPHTAPSK